MTDALTPALALAYLCALSVDVRAGAVLSASGACLAGEPGLARRAREQFAAAEADQVEFPMGDAVVFAARDDAHAVAVCCGRHALPGLVRWDLTTVLERLAGAR